MLTVNPRSKLFSITNTCFYNIETYVNSRSTPFGLYRDGSELRGVYYSKPEVARLACHALLSLCDYPILLGR